MHIGFLKAFRQDSLHTPSPGARSFSEIGPLGKLSSELGGASFNRGLYRVIGADQRPSFDDRVFSAFPEARSKARSFGYDWLGRIFAASTDGSLIYMFEPGTGKVLELATSVEEFHEQLLPGHKEEALAQSFFDSWLAMGGASPAPHQCIGYKLPLFLGGEDVEQNLELLDLDVYWELMTQLIAKINGK